MSLTIAITGGTGFVGSHVLDAARAAGHGLRALTRRPQPARDGVVWVSGLAELCDGVDVLVHIAGVTNARTMAEFEAGNAGLTRAVLAAAARAGVELIVHVSSLAARRPDLSVYGASKAAAEAVVSAGPARWAMLRPPGVYGPRDTEMLALFKAARVGIVPVPDARGSLIHAVDLAQALLRLAEDMAGPALVAGQVFEIDDGAGGHHHRDIARAAGAAQGRQPMVVTVPHWGLRAAAGVATAAARLRGRLPTLSFDRAGYLAHDWCADAAPLRAAVPWTPRFALREGMADTARWYSEAGWL
ncbi:NAD-dependent epimerase/dehydratase family protein [Sandaracinobacteroides saxicola]|uniref:NAD(P)-dependent oxidoreductase n=1 Tax=Sandaracinobacteroides saxicola TaxID=2759707 RepID=A0A7G5IDQ7_9SPHN|nr:NAD(P)-dependent oxidoreductase [Sandaracinobacteroides saxicola]QMW21499.1 NAD(P)-dependent oxidoreductase [Sandaracinobacteroides saxicola]